MNTARFPQRLQRPGALCLAVCVFLVGLVFASTAATFRQDCDALTQAPHRLSGTPAAARAAAYIHTRLASLSPDELVLQPFAGTQTEVHVCRITIEGDGNRSLDLLPMRPNGIIPPVTPPGGLRGPLVHVGQATAADFARQSVRDAIVVADYNTGQSWLRAFRLGARAIIFTSSAPNDSHHAHYVESSTNLPRFYYPGPASDLPAGASATLHSEITWTAASGTNVLAYFKGTDPVFSQGRDEVIILATHLDTFGEVPRLTPGARAAANCAALLKLAEHLAVHRPKRHVLLAFFDNQARGHAGVSAFYRALENDKEEHALPARRQSWDAENIFLDNLEALVQSEDPLKTSSSVRRQLLDRLADKAKARAYVGKDEAYRLRDERFTLIKTHGRDSLPPQAQERIEQINQQLAAGQPDRDAWNELQRMIGREKRSMAENPEEGAMTRAYRWFQGIFSKNDAEEMSPLVRAKLTVVMDGVREDIQLRRREMAQERETLAADQRLLEMLGNQWICLHASLLLGDTTERWGLVIGGESPLHSSQDNPGLYGKIQATFLKAHGSLGGRDGNESLFLPASADQTLPQTRVLWGAPFLIHSGEIAGLFGIYNLAFGTVQEALPWEGTPDDTLARLDLERIEAQALDIARLLCGNGDPDTRDDAVANQDGLSLRRGIVAGKEYVTPSFKDDSVHGPMVMGLLPGSSIPNTPMPGATVQFRLRASNSLAYNPVKPAGFDMFQILRTSQNGVYALGPVGGGWAWRVRGGFAAIFDDRGEVTEVSDLDSYAKIRYRLNVFRCNAGQAALPPQLRTDKLPGEEVKILSARANADLETTKSYSETADGMVCWYSGDREKGVKLFSLRQLVGLNNGPEDFAAAAPGQGDPNGTGFYMMDDPPTIDVPARSAADLWRLNESRLAILREKGIQDSSLAELHGRSEDILIEASGEPSPLRREALSTSSFWSSQPVYRKVRSMLDDLVFAVLILLALSVPFAFALERVLIGATTIYRQISWFVSFFAITFVILYLSHPAFALANTPIVIFLGFAILVMSVLVICIIMRKFEYELKALQGMTATVHAADVSSISTFMAAMHMGISTMRRRPMRTALTAVTIILLTFTILCFASFGTQSGVVPLFTAPNPSYAGIFIHHVNWNPLSEDLRDVIRGRWGDRLEVCRRLWISPKTQDNPGILISRADGTHPVTIRGILGIDPPELGQRQDLQTLFGELADDTVLITSAVAKALDVDVGEEILLKGRRLKVGRLLDAVRVAAAKDMDASSILPADFTEASSTQDVAGAEEEQELMTQRNWASLPVDSVAVVTADTAMSLGAALHGLMAYAADSTEAVELVEHMCRMIAFPLAATRDNGVYRHVLATVLHASGARDLFFPIVLGGLVIFGTMLGSVADRQKEIYTFSALGLAPKHVATLFFAESMVYSLLGGLGGYLLAQGTMKILGVLSEHGLVRVPEMNMSSTNTIVTILIVMATVLVSAIYPAVKASRSANPGLMRMWRPPAPDGDILDLVFPFTVSEYDITGVVSFLREHFNNHTDTGLGRFMTNAVQLVKEADGSLGLDASLALAPFDLGVSQTFALRSAPSEIPGIDEVRVVLQRLSGQPKDWRRLNKVFLDDLRKQFLIWRSIPQETMELYRQRTLTALGDDPEATRPSEDA